MTTKPCQISYCGNRYQINPDGSVYFLSDSVPFTNQEPPETATAVRHEASRQRRNSRARERYQAIKDLTDTRPDYHHRTVLARWAARHLVDIIS